MRIFQRGLNIIGKYRYQVILITVALTWLMAFNCLTQIGGQDWIYPDSASYLEAARNLYVYNRGHNYRPMLIALIHGAPYVFGAGDQAVLQFGITLNILAWVAFIVLLFQLLKKFVGGFRAFLLAFASIFILGNSALAFHLLTENIFMLFMLTGFWLLMKYIRTRHYGWLSASVATILLTALIKPGMLFFALLYMLFFIRQLVISRWSKYTVFVYSALTLILVQCAGLKYQFGNFTISYIDAVTYYNYLGKRANDQVPDKSLRNQNLKIYSLSCPDQKKLASDDLQLQIKENPENLFSAYVQNLVENATTESLAIADSKNIKKGKWFLANELSKISRWQNIFLSVITFLLAAHFFIRYYRTDTLAFVISAFILYTMLVSGISFGQGDRFNVITFPFGLILLGRLLSRQKSGAY